MKPKQEKRGKKLYRKALERLKVKQNHLEKIYKMICDKEQEIVYEKRKLAYMKQEIRQELAYYNKYHPALEVSEAFPGSPVADDLALQFIMECRISKPYFITRKNHNGEQEGLVKMYFKTKNGQEQFFWALSPKTMKMLTTNSNEFLRDYIANEFTSSLLHEISKKLK